MFFVIVAILDICTDSLDRESSIVCRRFFTILVSRVQRIDQSSISGLTEHTTSSST